MERKKQPIPDQLKRLIEFIKITPEEALLNFHKAVKTSTEEALLNRIIETVADSPKKDSASLLNHIIDLIERDKTKKEPISSPPHSS